MVRRFIRRRPLGLATSHARQVLRSRRPIPRQVWVRNRVFGPDGWAFNVRPVAREPYTYSGVITRALRNRMSRLRLRRATRFLSNRRMLLNRIGRQRNLPPEIMRNIAGYIGNDVAAVMN